MWAAERIPTGWPCRGPNERAGTERSRPAAPSAENPARRRPACLAVRAALAGLWPALGVAGLFICLALAGIPAPASAVGASGAAGGFGGRVRRAAGAWPARAAAAGCPCGGPSARRQRRASGTEPLAVLADRPARAPADADPAPGRIVAGARVARVVKCGGCGSGCRAPASPGLTVAPAGRPGRGAGGPPSSSPVRRRRRAWPKRSAHRFQQCRAPAAQLQVWISPPAYTGLAPGFPQARQPTFSARRRACDREPDRR